jgi:transposase
MVVFAIILKIAFCTTYDGIEGKLKVMREMIREITGYERMPTHSVIHDGMKRISMKYLRRIFRLMISKTRRRRAAMDSTGFSTRNSSVWYDIRIRKQGKKRDCLKLHVLVDVDTGEILQVRITKLSAHDGPRGRAMLREVWSVNVVTGDTSYAGRETCTLAVQKGARPFFKPRKDARTRSKGHPAYKVMVRSYKNDKDAWDGVYHIRSFVEAVFAAVKKRFGKILLSIKKSMQRKELFLKAFCHNVKEGLYNARARQLGIDRWVVC